MYRRWLGAGAGSRRRCFLHSLRPWHTSGVRSSSFSAGNPDKTSVVAAVGVTCGLCGLLWQALPPRTGALSGSLPTEPETIDAALELLQTDTPLGNKAGRELLFVDLGSGDGRMVNSVVRRFGCRGVGVDVVPESVEEAIAISSRELPLEYASSVRFICADMGHVDLAMADVLFMFIPDIMLRLVVRKLLPYSGLRPGTYLLIEDAPIDLRHGYGLRHLKRGGVRPTSARNPPLDLFEWRGMDPCREQPQATAFFACPQEEGLVKIPLGPASE